MAHVNNTIHVDEHGDHDVCIHDCVKMHTEELLSKVIMEKLALKHQVVNSKKETSVLDASIIFECETPRDL